MSSKTLCTLGDLAEGEMRDFVVDGREIVVTWVKGGGPRAFDARCPHEGISLAFGEFDGQELVCGAHQWSFDGASGECLFPGNCRLQRYGLRLEGDQVLIELRAGADEPDRS
jgi:toluene monooxygenase system ferredoxin subunit